MPTGLANQLTRQIGENLITAELGRHELIAIPFPGNIPNIDILAQKMLTPTVRTRFKPFTFPWTPIATKLQVPVPSLDGVLAILVLG